MDWALNKLQWFICHNIKIKKKQTSMVGICKKLNKSST